MWKEFDALQRLCRWTGFLQSFAERLQDVSECITILQQSEAQHQKLAVLKIRSKQITTSKLRQRQHCLFETLLLLATGVGSLPRFGFREQLLRNKSTSSTGDIHTCIGGVFQRLWDWVAINLRGPSHHLS